MGTFIKLPGVNPGTEYPDLTSVDALLPETGALYLYEFAHPRSLFPAGVPANGQALRNLAREQAAELIGVTEESVDAALAVSAYTAGSAVLERTEKGGLHSLHSKTAAVSGGIHAPVPIAILNYLASVPTHDIYASIWGVITRAGTAVDAWTSIVLGDTADTGNLLFSISQGNNHPVSVNNLGARRIPAGSWTSTPAPGTGVFAGLAVSQYSGTVTAVRNGKAFGIRTGAPFTDASGTPSQQRSAIVYRTYLEDLTVSGRTYAEVDDLDYGLYTEHVLTAGGRYHDDSWTDPATLG